MPTRLLCAPHGFSDLATALDVRNHLNPQNQMKVCMYLHTLKNKGNKNTRQSRIEVLS